MHVLHIYKDYPPVIGGIEYHLRLLAEGLVRRGLDVTVLVTSLHRTTTEEVQNGVRVIRAGRWATVSSTPLGVALFRWVQHLSADITHLHFPYPLGELAHLTLGHSQTTILTYHSDIIRQRLLERPYRPFLWRILQRADRILATSPQ
jgi:rhamnosyl/mannosyltransferase